MLNVRIYRIKPRFHACVENVLETKGEKVYEKVDESLLCLVIEDSRRNDYGLLSKISLDYVIYVQSRIRGQYPVITYENGEVQVYNKPPIEGLLAVFGKRRLQKSFFIAIAKICKATALELVAFDIDRKFELLKNNFHDFRRLYVKKITRHSFLQDVALGGVRLELSDEIDRYTRRLGGRITTAAFMFEGKWTLVSSDGRIYSPSKYAYKFKEEYVYKLLKKLSELNLIIYETTF